MTLKLKITYDQQRQRLSMDKFQKFLKELLDLGIEAERTDS